jgi:hypothetical protein
MNPTDDEILSGARRIAEALDGRSIRSTYTALERGEVPATKILGVWTSTRQLLLHHVTERAKAGE